MWKLVNTVVSELIVRKENTKCVDKISLAQDGDTWEAIWISWRNFRSREIREISWLRDDILGSEGWLFHDILRAVRIGSSASRKKWIKRDIPNIRNEFVVFPLVALHYARIHTWSSVLICFTVQLNFSGKHFASTWPQIPQCLQIQSYLACHVNRNCDV